MKTLKKNFEMILFVLAVCAIALLSFSMGYVVKGLTQKGAPIEGVSQSVPPASPYRHLGAVILPDNVEYLETGDKNDGQCMALVMGRNNEPDYVVRPCPHA